MMEKNFKEFYNYCSTNGLKLKNLMSEPNFCEKMNCAINDDNAFIKELEKLQYKLEHFESSNSIYNSNLLVFFTGLELYEKVIDVMQKLINIDNKKSFTSFYDYILSKYISSLAKILLDLAKNLPKFLHEIKIDE